MKCRIDGCDRESDYKGKELCQKHYFRLWRTGGTELLLDKKERELGYRTAYRVTMPGKGYQRVYEPTHPLADKGGYVSEHRMIVFNRYGHSLPDCEICSKPTNWETCHIDHKDEDVKNNSPDNLRPLCRYCNTSRNLPPAYMLGNRLGITFDGVTQTAYEWARDPRVCVSHATIKRRIAAGMSDADALFSEKVTHNGRISIDKRQRLTEFKHQRKNAVKIEIDGELKTSMEWSRDPRCEVSDGTLRNRVRAGHPHDMSILKRIYKCSIS